MKIRIFFSLTFVALILLSSCRGSLEETEYQKIRSANRMEKNVSRKSSNHLIAFFSEEIPQKDAYPWQKIDELKHPFITKEFFRCKGDKEHPSYLKADERIFDCNGFERHSLPLKDDKEFVYPVLISLLNHLQKTLNAPVTVTCGHRCPQHNRYCDTSVFNSTSKHMIGAEVDFLVQGYEKKPEEVIDAIMSFYKQKEYEGKEKYQSFQRYQKNDLNVSTPPWYNQEVFIKLYLAHEGRDYDNNHTLPYVSIQVRYDSQSNQRVTYTWQQAFYSYLRY